MKKLEKIYYKLSNNSVVMYTTEQVINESVDLFEVKKDAIECLYLYSDNTFEMSVKQNDKFVHVPATEHNLTVFQLAS